MSAKESKYYIAFLFTLFLQLGVKKIKLAHPKILPEAFEVCKYEHLPVVTAGDNELSTHGTLVEKLSTEGLRIVTFNLI